MEGLAKADKEVLVEIVKFAQKQGLRGDKGGWKDFLNSYDRKFGHSVSDPSRRSSDVLIAFLNTFPGEEQKSFLNMLRRHRAHVTIMTCLQQSLNNDDPFQRLVRLTHEHPHYRARYFFPSENEDWVVIPLGEISKTRKRADVIAIDCEMVLCQNGTEEVVQVCAVDKNLEVKLNLLIKPSYPVVDYRTDITGIVAKDLEEVATSLADAQKSLKKLLMHGTVLVGHSLHNDLQALKIDHRLVIDTAHIFKYADMTLRTPSLNNLCQSVLGYKIRKEGEPHNCVGDAQAAMKLVLAKLEYGFEDPISIEKPQELLGNTEKLLLHRIPAGVTSTELLKLFSPKFDVTIQDNIKRSGQFYATSAIFKDSNEADEAFREAHGLYEKDSSGRPQKLVTLQLTSTKKVNFYIRRMMPFCLPNNSNGQQKDSCQDEIEFVTNIKNDRDEKSGSFKDRKVQLRREDVDKKKNDTVVDDVNEKLKELGKQNDSETRFTSNSLEMEGLCTVGMVDMHAEVSNEKKAKKKRRLDDGKKDSTSEICIFANIKTAGGRADDGNVLCSCKHVEEIDRLKREICQREEEIYNLQKILNEHLAQNLKR